MQENYINLNNENKKLVSQRMAASSRVLGNRKFVTHEFEDFHTHIKSHTRTSVNQEFVGRNTLRPFMTRAHEAPTCVIYVHKVPTDMFNHHIHAAKSV